MSNEKKIIYFGCGLLLLAILISGCGRKAADGEDWEDEVVMGHDCGLEGFSCCADKEPACQYGLECCTDPNDIKSDMCVADCACGGEDRFCCKDEPRCDPGLGCAGSRCVPCGGLDEPCCADGGCKGDLACDGDKCVACGLSGHPCCRDGIDCINGDASDPDRTECREDICTPCGVKNRAACQGEPACSADHLLNNGLCYRCGDFNQPCCEYGCSPADLECSLGFCVKTVK